MPKVFYYIIALLTLILFVLIMNSGDYLRQPTSDSDNVARYINRLENNILHENWTDAQNNYTKLKTAWKTVTKRIQFSVEKDEINYIDINMARLGAYLITKEEEDALAELYELEEHWNNLNQ